MSDPLSGLEVISGVDRLVNVAQLTVYPLETAGALQAIWTARGVLRVARLLDWGCGLALCRSACCCLYSSCSLLLYSWHSTLIC